MEGHSMIGYNVGRLLGVEVGCIVGKADGLSVGAIDGLELGTFVGAIDGLELGTFVGGADGTALGLGVTSTSTHDPVSSQQTLQHLQITFTKQSEESSWTLEVDAQSAFGMVPCSCGLR